MQRKRLPRFQVSPVTEDRFKQLFELPCIGGWAYTWAHNNQWRTLPDYDWEDLMIEARMALLRICRAYPTIATEKHLAAVFRRAMSNRIYSLNKVRNRRPAKSATDVSAETDVTFQRPSHYDGRNNDGEDRQALSDLCLSAPRPIRRLIQAFIKNPLRPRPQKVEEGGRFETDNEFLARLAGVDPDRCDVREFVMEWFHKIAPEFNLPYV